ncbi:MAG: polyprenyl diphosphate synthase, partial [Gemmatimonadaceae bacterium]
VVEGAARLGVGTLTIYAFSSDNWRRPTAEVQGLMRLFRRYLASETARCVANGIALRIIGRRDRLSDELRRAIDAAEQTTARGARMLLRVALDYSARDALVVAAERARRDDLPVTRERLSALVGEATHGGAPAPDVDLLIRTGGEQRLSDFLLWECAYAELLFVSTMWPDFGAPDLERALAEFRSRQRRFGGVPAADAAALGEAVG